MIQNIRRIHVTLALALSTVATSSLASAQFVDNFESYAAGTALEGQGGWGGWDGVSTTATQVSNSQAHTGSLSVSVGNGSDSVHAIPGATSGQWIVSTFSYLPSASVGNFDWLIMNEYNDLGPYEWGCYYEFNATSGVLNFFGGGVVQVSPIIRDAWVELRVEIDLDADSAAAYYNGSLISSYAWTTGYDGFQSHAAATIKALNLYASPGSTGELFLDDMRAVRVGGPGQPYCFGDSMGASCPCGNLSGVGEGCANSTGLGAILTGSGIADVANDSLLLSATQCPPGIPGIFFQGNNALTNPVLLGDGLLCFSGPIQRFGVTFTDAFGDADSSATTLSVDGLVNSGDTRSYQFWFRDVPGPCGGGSNLSNAVEVTWL